MRLHRFIQTGIDTTNKEIAITEGELIHQIRSVLRLSVGDHIIVADGIESEAEIEITQESKTEIRGVVIARSAQEAPLHPFHIYVSTPKKAILETIVQMCTELGTSSITPLICERTVKTGVVLPRLEKIAKEASELSGRYTVPVISMPLLFKEAVTKAVKEKKHIMLFDKAGTPFKKTEGDTAIFIGPEGGFTKEEIAYFKENGGVVQNLGTNTLRIETAVVASASLFL